MKIDELEINVKEGKLEVKHPKYKNPMISEIPKDSTACLQFLKKVSSNIVRLNLVSLPLEKVEEILVKLALTPETEETPKEVDMSSIFEPLVTVPEEKQVEEKTENSELKEPQEPEVAIPKEKEVKPEVELPDWTDNLSDEQRKWISTLAKQNNMLEKEYINILTKRAREAVIPTHAINILYQDAWKHDLIRLSKEKKRFVVFAISTGDEKNPISELKFLVPSSIDIEIGQCYSIVGERYKGRCIALSPAISSKHYNGWELPTYDKIERISDMNIIPQPLECYQPAYLVEVVGKAKNNIKGFHECISATVEDVRKPREDLYYLEVNDGTLDKSTVVSVGPLFPENPWKISSKEIEESKGKTALIYGFIIYEPPTKDWYRERLTVNPSFMAFA